MTAAQKTQCHHIIHLNSVAAAGTAVGRTVSQVLVGWIPGWGNAINASTAASVVEGIGWSTADHFHADYLARHAS